MEVSYPVTHKLVLYDVHFLCEIENCNGQLISTNVMLTVDPPLFPHTCDVCGNKQNLLKQYPRKEHGG